MRRLGFVLIGAVGFAACSDPPEPECSNAEKRLVFQDKDGDGFGRRIIGYRCAVGAGQADNNIDCNDNDALVFPGALEVCDNVDNNCDGGIDEDLNPLDYYLDADGDGFGDPSSVLRTCDDPGEGYTFDNTDCDDENGEVSPLEIEQCDNLVDDDCNGVVDDQFETCFDEKDNNCDGLVDCEDPDCVGSTACVQPCTDIAISSELPVIHTGFTTTFGNDYSPGCAGSIFQSDSPDVVLLWTSQITGVVQIDTTGSDFDTVLSVFRGNCDAVADTCNDNGLPGTITSLVTMEVQQGEQLSIVIDGTGRDDRGDFVLNITQL